MSIKISEMTVAASTTGTESIPIVQSGINKKVTPAVLLASCAITSNDTTTFSNTGANNTLLISKAGNASYSGVLKALGSSNNGITLSSNNSASTISANLPLAISTAESFTPGNITITGGAVTPYFLNYNLDAGNVSIAGGLSSGDSGSGGDVNVFGGHSDGDSAYGGDVTIRSGDALWTGHTVNGSGGGMSISGGDGASGGSISIYSGTDTSGLSSGASGGINIGTGGGWNQSGISIFCSDGDASSGIGGAIELRASNGFTAGYILLKPGYGAGTNGYVDIQDDQGNSVVMVNDTGAVVKVKQLNVTNNVNGGTIGTLAGYYPLYNSSGTLIGRAPYYNA